jgi:phosphonoacetaldehyde dehydrogenase
MRAVSAIAVHSPFSGELVGSAPVSASAEVVDALDLGAAYVSQLSRHQRSQLLFAVAERLGSLAGELSTLISRESGLCLKDTRHEVARAVDVFRFAAIEALRDDGETFAGDVSPSGRARRAHTLRVPVGLVAAITPFNHPLNQVAHKLAPAIAAGAPIVLKPSERTPLSAIRLGELLLDQGLPPAAARSCAASPPRSSTSSSHTKASRSCRSRAA